MGAARSDLFDRALRQPDPRTCGAAALVVARMLNNPAYDDAARSRFAQECLAMHKRVTSLSDVQGRLQAPWPRMWGTPPWAVARQLTWTTGVEYRTQAVRPGTRAALLDRSLAAAATGLPVALYVGSRWLPRHVVLLVDAPDAARPSAYDPASGRLDRFSPERFIEGRLALGGWSRPWFLVSPRAPLPDGPRRR